MIKNKIKEYIKKSLQHLDIDFNNIIIQDPRNHKDVDYATNIAMQLSKKVHKAPAEIATEIANKMNSLNDNFFEKITVAQPGFINFKVNSSSTESNTYMNDYRSGGWGTTLSAWEMYMILGTPDSWVEKGTA